MNSRASIGFYLRSRLKHLWSGPSLRLDVSLSLNWPIKPNLLLQLLAESALTGGCSELQSPLPASPLVNWWLPVLPWKPGHPPPVSSRVPEQSASCWGQTGRRIALIAWLATPSSCRRFPSIKSSASITRMSVELWITSSGLPLEKPVASVWKSRLAIKRTSARWSRCYELKCESAGWQNGFRGCCSPWLPAWWPCSTKPQGLNALLLCFTLTVSHRIPTQSFWCLDSSNKAQPEKRVI